MTVSEIQAAIDEVTLMHKALSENLDNLNKAVLATVQREINVPALSELKGMLSVTNLYRTNIERRLVELRDKKFSAEATLEEWVGEMERPGDPDHA